MGSRIHVKIVKTVEDLTKNKLKKELHARSAKCMQHLRAKRKLKEQQQKQQQQHKIGRDYLTREEYANNVGLCPPL